MEKKNKINNPHLYLLNWYDIAKLKKNYNLNNNDNNLLKEELKRSVAMDFVSNFFTHKPLMNTLTFSPNNAEYTSLDNYLSRPETIKKMLKVYRRVMQHQPNQLKNYISEKIEERGSPPEEIRNILKDGNYVNPVINILGKK